MIEVKNIVKYYGKKRAVADVSFSVGEGEVVGFLGPNGAGKSTVMNILTGYLSSDSGDVFIGGIDISENPDRAKRLIGYLPEQPPLYKDMKVSEYLDFVYGLKKCSLPKKAHLEEIEKVTKIFDVKDRLIGNLSKGYRQRLGIAQALVGDPKVIILDEPTVGLDPKQIIEIRSLIRRLGRKHTVILSTHILSEVQAVCDRIIIIQNGKIIADEKTDDIASAVNKRKRHILKICEKPGAVTRVLSEIDGVAEVTSTGETDGDAFVYCVETEKGYDIRKKIFSACVENSFVIIGFEDASVGLEEVFIRLTDDRNTAKKMPGKENRV